MRWKDPIEKIFLLLPGDLHREMKSRAARAGKKLGDYYTDLVSKGMEQLDHPKCIPAKSTPLKWDDLPASVLELCSTHRDDPRCMECLVALAKIWGVGDEEIKHAITSNCKVFARASEAMERAEYAEETGHQKRVGALLDSEARLDQEIDDPPQAIGTPGTSRRGTQKVGGRSTRAGKTRR